MEQSVYQRIAEEDARDEDLRDSFPPVALPVSDWPPNPTQVLTPRELALWRWANVDNLDLFLEEVYEYFNEKGFYCIVLRRVLQMATILFVVIFSTYLYSCIDYSKLIGARTLADIRIDRCISKTSFFHKFCLWGFAALWLLKSFQYIGDLRRLWEIHDFYHYLLGVTENEIQTISWQQIVERMGKLRSTNMTTTRRLDAHGIVNRIMRRENYMISLYNKDILDLNIVLPFGGSYEFLTKTLEWSIWLCIGDFVFNDRGQLRSIVLKEEARDMLEQGLKRRFQLAAILNALLAPVAVFYMTLYYFFRYFNDYRSDPKTLGSRVYVPLAEWKFRELNELYHLFKRRLSMSEQPAKRYISLFPREKTELLVRFVIFVASSFAAVLAVLSIYDPELLKVDIRHEQNVGFYLTSLGLVILVSRAMLSTPEDQAIFMPEAAMRQIVEFTHYMPDKWEGKLHTEPVKNEFMELYDLKAKVILRDLASVFLNPVILGVKLAERSGRIIDFFREFSVNVDDLGGYVCSLAVFNSDKVSKIKARSDALDQFYSTQDGKMLKSYLNFMDVYGPPNQRRQYGYASTALQSQYQSHYQSQYPIQGSADTSPQVPGAAPSVNHIAAPDMAASVMGQYDRLRAGGLRSVSEERSTSGSDDVGELHLYSESEDDESIADDGVLGLLNNLYKQ